jgi:hypothetical protein
VVAHGKVALMLLRYIQILADNRLLAAIRDESGDLGIYLERPSNLGQAAPKKTLRHDKFGDRVLLAFNEPRRMLAICVASQVC